MDELKIKDAFQKVKDDISSLRLNLTEISSQLDELKRTLHQTDKPTDRQTSTFPMQTDTQTMPTEPSTMQTTEKDSQNKTSLQGPKASNFNVSIGNDGVQTDRQTNRQTDRQTDNSHSIPFLQERETISTEKFALMENTSSIITKVEKATELINSLDAFKKDLRRQFKRLTPQEMLIFSTIYQLTDQDIDVDYTLISKKTSLSESSIRDYVQKILKKGIPLRKTRENNKRILLTVPPEFKRLASLETLNILRNL